MLLPTPMLLVLVGVLLGTSLMMQQVMPCDGMIFGAFWTGVFVRAGGVVLTFCVGVMEKIAVSCWYSLEQWRVSKGTRDFLDRR